MAHARKDRQGSVHLNAVHLCKLIFSEEFKVECAGEVNACLLRNAVRQIVNHPVCRMRRVLGIRDDRCINLKPVFRQIGAPISDFLPV